MDIELFHHDDAMLGSERCGELVNGVAPDVGSPCMGPSQSLPDQVSSLGTTLAASQLSIEPTKLPQRYLQRARIRNRWRLGRQYCQMVNAYIHPNDGRSTATGGNMSVDQHREGDEPAIRRLANCCGQDTSGFLLDPTSEFPCRLVRLENPDPRKLNMLRSGRTRIAPVVNRQVGRVRFFLFLPGNPTRRPLRWPLLESAKFLSARASPSNPLL
jgi:hypothetical protein